MQGIGSLGRNKWIRANERAAANSAFSSLPPQYITGLMEISSIYIAERCCFAAAYFQIISIS
jgi:hypothetical protein